MALKVGELFASANIETSGFTQGISTMLGSARGFSAKAIKIFGGVSTAVAGLTAAIGGKAVNAAADWEQSMVEMEKVMDPETAAAMEGRIKDMSTEMGLSKDQIAAVTASAGRLGVRGTKNIDQFTRVVSKMGVATDVSGDQAAVALKKIIDMTDSGIDDIGRMGSAINELSNNMGTTSSEIIRATQRSAATLNQLGASSQEILALNATMNTVSPTARLAATSLEMMGDALMDPKAVKAMANAMGINVDRFQKMVSNSPVDTLKRVAEFIAGGTEKAKKLQNQLGKTGLKFARFGQVTSQQEDSQKMVNEQWENATSLQEEFLKANDTLNSKMNQTMDAVNNVAASIGDVLMPKIKTLLEKYIKPAVKQFGKWFDEIGGVEGAFTKLKDIMKNWLGEETLKDLKKAGQNLANFFTTLKDVLGPTMEKMLPVVKNLFQVLADLLAGDFGGAGQNIKESLQSIGDVVATLFKEIVEHTGLSKLVDRIKNIIDMIKGLVNKIPFVSLGEGGEAPSGDGEASSGDGGKTTGSASNFAQEISQQLQKMLKQVWQMPASQLQQQLSNLPDVLMNAAQRAGEFPIPQQALQQERATLLENLVPALEGKIQPKTSTETNVDFTVGENVTVREKRSIEELNRAIQRAYENWERRQGNQ